MLFSIRTGFSKALRVDFSSHICVDIDFAMCCISGIVQSYDDYQNGKSGNAEVEGDMSLNQCQTTKVHADSKIVNHALTQIALAVTLTGTFWIWNWHCCKRNIRFQVNSCQLQIYVEDSDFHTSIFVYYICIPQWRKRNFHICCLMYPIHLLLFHVFLSHRRWCIEV